MAVGTILIRGGRLCGSYNMLALSDTFYQGSLLQVELCCSNSAVPCSNAKEFGQFQTAVNAPFFHSVFTFSFVSIRGGVEDTRLEAKNTKKIRGQ